MWAFARGFWPRNPFTWLGLLLGAMSMLALLQQGFEYGLSAPVSRLLNYYETLVQVTFASWAEPIVGEWLAQARRYTGLDLHLYPHWKHIFVLMGIYFFRDAWIALRSGYVAGGTFRILWGSVCAGGSSVFAGGIALGQADQWANFVMAAIPIAGVALYEIGRGAWAATFVRERWARLYHKDLPTWWGYFRERLYSTFRDASVGVALLLAALQIPAVQSLQSPGLAVLAALVFLLALWWLRIGARDADDIRREGEIWTDAFWRTSGAKLGAAMIGIFFWVSVFVAANAGLEAYGL